MKPTAAQRAAVHEAWALLGYEPGTRIRRAWGFVLTKRGLVWARCMGQMPYVDAVIPFALRYMALVEFPASRLDVAFIIARFLQKHCMSTKPLALRDRAAGIWQALTGPDTWDKDLLASECEMLRYCPRAIVIAERIAPRTLLEPFHCWVCGCLHGWRAVASERRDDYRRVHAACKDADAFRRLQASGKWKWRREISDIVCKAGHLPIVSELARMKLDILGAQSEIAKYRSEQTRERHSERQRSDVVANGPDRARIARRALR
jgi:hypothetical protein